MFREIDKGPEVDLPKSEFLVKLEALWAKGNFVCVGLDSDYPKIPPHLKKERKPWASITLFSEKIMEATHDMVCAYKPNIAFYEALGGQGLWALENTISYAKSHFPIIPVILDAKRADIGNTNIGYAQAAFDQLGVDAITVHPYLGSVFFDEAGELQQEALKPFLSRKDKGIIVLCKTSNPAAGELQDLPIDLTRLSDSYGKKFGDMGELREIVGRDIVPLYQIIAYRVSRFWNKNGNCGLVVGATYPEELAEVRKIVGDMPILIPGIGAQGGEIEATVRAVQGRMIINSSRGIIFASQKEDFAEAARKATEQLRSQINLYVS